MSAIAGILSFDTPVDRAALERFTARLAHRGPHGGGLILDGKLGLGHRRHAVFDQGRHARCPMPYEDSQPVATPPTWRTRLAMLAGTACEDATLTPYRYWLTFDGEIYNFLELHRELSAMGYRFRSQGDAEVVLAAYAQWGEACLARFNGCWAFALWDRQDRSLLLARDRFGERPLYYLHSPARVAFASEMKAFLALEGFRPALHAKLVPRILEDPAATEGTTDETLLAGVRRLPSGHIARITADGALHVKRWWDMKNHPVNPGPRYEDQVAEVRDLFLDSVRLRLRSDLPLATCLDGNFAAHAIAGAIGHLESTKADLTRTPRGRRKTFSAASDETDITTKKISTIGTPVEPLAVATTATPAEIADVLWSTEAVAPDFIATDWSLYQALRTSGRSVALGAHGADELLGGSSPHLDWVMPQVNPNLAHEFIASRLPARLREIDHCAMAHAVSARSPFLDWRLATLIHALPAESKFGGGFTQRVLRDAMAGILPDALRHQRTRGRPGRPMHERFNRELAPVLRQLVNHERCVESPHWNGRTFRQSVLAKSEAGAWTARDESEIRLVWLRLNLVLWELLFIEQAKPAAIFR